MTVKELQLFENLTVRENAAVNVKIEQLGNWQQTGGITEKEKQYMFLIFLQNKLNHYQVFEVYTNAKL